MPLYDFFCPSCNEMFEGFSHRPIEAGATRPCPCGGAQERRPTFGTVQLVGITPSKPKVIQEVGRFETNAQFRKFQVENPDMVIRPGSDLKRMREEGMSKADKQVQNHGYKNHSHYIRETTRELATRPK